MEQAALFICLLVLITLRKVILSAYVKTFSRLIWNQ